VVYFSALPKNEPSILVNMQAKRATVGNSRFVRTHYLKVGFYPVSCIITMLKTFGKQVLNFFRIEAIVRLLKNNSALRQDGWYLSVKTRKPVDKNGDSIPWFTYPAIDFLKTRIHKTHTVFEYGTGGSSIWLSQHAQSVTSVEHVPTWYAETLQKCKECNNLQVFLVSLKPEYKQLDYHTLAFLKEQTPSDNEYINKITEGGGEFDIVVATKSLNESGIIILDNTNYALELAFGINYMQEQNYKRLDFWGMIPIFGEKSCTSIFYRNNNCLGL
jgi:hypothetical protein